MPDPRIHSTGEKPRERRKFHRGEHRVAGAGGEDPDAHAQSLRPREDGAGLRDATSEPQVFDDPQFVEPEPLGFLRERPDLIGGEVAGQHDADGGIRHRSPPLDSRTTSSGWNRTVRSCVPSGSSRCVRRRSTAVYPIRCAGWRIELSGTTVAEAKSMSS